MDTPIASGRLMPTPRLPRGLLLIGLALGLCFAGTPKAQANPPYLVTYLQLDGKFYRVLPNTSNLLFSYFWLSGGGRALVAEGAQMAVCTHTDAGLQTPIALFYGYTDPALGPVENIHYADYSSNQGRVHVLTVTTSYRDTQCLGQVSVPQSYDRIFKNGFDI